MKSVSMLRSLGQTTVALGILLFFGVAQAAPPTARQQIDELLRLVEEKYVGSSLERAVEFLLTGR